MGITLKQVIDNNLLSDSIIDCIPHECECGAPIEFTDSLRQIYCSNDSCYYKVAARLESMAKAMQADGWGESTCIEVCRQCKFTSPYQVFLLEQFVKDGKTIPGVSAFPKKVASISDRKLRQVELWEIVKLAGIPSIETTAYKIFNGYDNLTEAFVDIEKGKVPFIAEKLGIKNSDTGVMAVRIYNTLLQYKDELMFGEKQFEVYKPTGETLYMAITGGVQGFRNKGEFISYINNRYGGKVNAMLMGSVTQQVEILVADGDTSSTKYKNAIKINTNYLAKNLENGTINESDIGNFKSAKDLHPIGEKIFITDSVSIFARLDKVYG